MHQQQAQVQDSVRAGSHPLQDRVGRHPTWPRTLPSLGLLGRTSATGIRQQLTPHTLDLLRLNSRLQDFRPAWNVYSGILLGGNKYIETLEWSAGFEGRV